MYIRACTFTYVHTHIYVRTYVRTVSMQGDKGYLVNGEGNGTDETSHEARVQLCNGHMYWHLRVT